MKSLLRKKSPADNRQKPSPPSVQNAGQPSSIETPLYAHFASIRPVFHPQEKSRPVVSGPMPLGRPSHAPLEANAGRRRNGESAMLRPRPSNSRPEMPPTAQFPPGVVPRDVLSLPDRTYQDARVAMAEAATQPNKALVDSFSDEHLAIPKPYRTTVTESVQYTRDVLPPRPVSPRSAPYAQKVVSATLYQSSPSSFPSVSKPYVTVTEAPIAARAHGGSRQTATLSAENFIPAGASTSDTTEPSPAESSSRFNDNLSPTGLPRPPNQAPPDVEQLRSVSASPHQGAVLAPSFNGRTDGTLHFGPLSGPPSDGPGQQSYPDRGTQRTPVEDVPPHREAMPSPQGGLYQSMLQTNAAEITLAPSATSPQSSEKYAVTATPARRANTQIRGRPLIFASGDPETELGLEQMRHGSPILTTRDHEFRPTPYDRGATHEVGQKVQQPQPQVVGMPSWNGMAAGSPERGAQMAPQRPSSHSQTYGQERTWTSQAVSSYENDPPPAAHPAVRRLSKASASRTHAAQPVLEERRTSPAEHSRKSSHGKLLSKKPPSPRPLLVTKPEPTSITTQFSPQARPHASLPVPSSSRPLPEPDSSLPPTPPEKSPSYDFRTEWSRHTESRSPPPLASTDDVEIEPRRDVRKSWAVPIPAAADLEEDYLPQPHVESALDVLDAPILDSLATREQPSRPSSLIGTDSIQMPEGGDQPQNDSLDNAIASSPPLAEDFNEHHSRRPQSKFQQPLASDGTSSVAADLEPIARPRARALPTPPSPEEYSRARARRRGTWLEKAVPADITELAEETVPKFYPLLDHLQIPELLTQILVHLSFYEWLVLWGGVCKVIRQTLDSSPALCDVALERYLGTVGYTRWSWPNLEPIRITLAEMHAYMRGVSVPVHVYSQSAFSILFSPPSEENALLVRAMKKETRAFNRVVIRLRVQAEADAEQGAAIRRGQSIGQPQPQRQNNGPPLSWSAGAAHGQNGKHRSVSRPSSRAPSPTNSAWSHGAGSQSHLPLGSTPTPTPGGFRSPLFRLRRAPLLRVFVPSSEGDWLSDAGVLDCETELRKAGILQLLRIGDVVWDTALGDEGNTGRLVWDGRYLVDLDYSFSQIGDVPPSLPALAFPPSYFHRVIRVAGDRNPIAHFDIRFWGEEITANLQLLQDRVRTETPQGTYHTVVRWVHRSSFTIRPPPGGAPVVMLPNRERRVVDPGWRGTVVVEAEGTNEGLADLRARCRGAFQPRAGDVAPPPGERERMVWRVLRERSRPGEIWIRAVSFKERLIP